MQSACAHRRFWVYITASLPFPRKEKPAPPSPGSDFTREDGDPAIPAGESQGSVGTGTHRIMGKEVKEEQNRLKGFVVSCPSLLWRLSV